MATNDAVTDDKPKIYSEHECPYCSMPLFANGYCDECEIFSLEEKRLEDLHAENARLRAIVEAIHKILIETPAYGVNTMTAYRVIEELRELVYKAINDGNE